MEQPVCWITNDMDRSRRANPGRQHAGWACWETTARGSLSLSYGNGKIFVFPTSYRGKMQEAARCRICSTGIMRSVQSG